MNNAMYALYFPFVLPTVCSYGIKVINATMQKWPVDSNTKTLVKLCHWLGRKTMTLDTLLNEFSHQITST